MLRWQARAGEHLQAGQDDVRGAVRAPVGGVRVQQLVAQAPDLRLGHEVVEGQVQDNALPALQRLLQPRLLVLPALLARLRSTQDVSAHAS